MYIKHDHERGYIQILHIWNLITLISHSRNHLFLKISRETPLSSDSDTTRGFSGPHIVSRSQQLVCEWSTYHHTLVFQC